MLLSYFVFLLFGVAVFHIGRHWRIWIRLVVALLVFLVPSIGLTIWGMNVGDTASRMCVQGNALLPTFKKQVDLLGIEWMERATFCDFGIYQVLMPVDGDTDAIVLLKNGKQFMIHQKGFGINLFQNYGGSESIPYVTLQDWDGDGIYERLDYALVDEQGNVIGNAQDKNLSGDVKVIRYKEVPNDSLQATPKRGAPER